MKRPLKRPWLLPLTPLWAAGTAWKNRSFDRHPESALKLQRPVISVGSLSAGGAGKTPFVIALGRALQQHGIAVDVLSRGYGRTDALTAKRVDSHGSAEDFGDEPLLIARALEAPVYVASKRVEAGRLAEADSSNSTQVHLLDDGFQHRQLARSIDIVLLTHQDVSDMLLPAGDLRESLQSLRRAHVIVVRAEEAASMEPVFARVLQGEQPQVWTVERRFTVAETSPRPLAFCGIARPQGFGRALAAHGIAPASLVALRDHQRYDADTVDRLLRSAKQTGADGFVTTAKDAVKLPAQLRTKLAELGPLAVSDIRVRIWEEERCMQAIAQMLAKESSA